MMSFGSYVSSLEFLLLVLDPELLSPLVSEPIW